MHRDKIAQFFWRLPRHVYRSHDLIGKRFSTTVIVLSLLSLVASLFAPLINWNVVGGSAALVLVSLLCLFSIQQGWGAWGRPLMVILTYVFIYASRVTNARPIMSSDISFILILFLNLLLPYLMIERRLAWLQITISLVVLISLLMLEQAIAYFGVVYQPEPGLVLQYTRWVISAVSTTAAFSYYNRELHTAEMSNRKLLANAESQNKTLIRQQEELKALQNELVHQEKMGMVDRIFSRVSHQLNSPLGALYSSVQQSAELARQVVRMLVAQPEDEKGTREIVVNDYLYLAEHGKLDIGASQTYKARRERTLVIADALKEAHPALAVSDAACEEWAKQILELSLRPPIPALYLSTEVKPYLPNLVAIGLWIRTNWVENKTISALRTLSLNLKAALGGTASEPPAPIDVAERAQQILLHFNEYYPQINWQLHLPQANVMHIGVLLHFRTLMYNLLTNAAEANEGVGNVDVTVESKSEALKIIVSDTGSGISPELTKQLFQPLVTTKERHLNLGLGLYVVKQVVEAQQGTVEVQSQPGHTVFTVLLPWPRAQQVKE